MNTPSPQIQALPTGGYISTSMVFGTRGFQNSANSTYLYVSSFNASKPATPYTFKTDRERMLFRIGQQATVPGATGY
jgi:hypothetical protein